MDAPESGARRGESTRRQFLLGGAVAGVGAVAAIGIDAMRPSTTKSPVTTRRTALGLPATVTPPTIVIGVLTAYGPGATLTITPW